MRTLTIAKPSELEKGMSVAKLDYPIMSCGVFVSSVFTSEEDGMTYIVFAYEPESAKPDYHWEESFYSDQEFVIL